MAQSAWKPQPSITVTWVRCDQDNKWCPLEWLNLDSVGVRLGQGKIKERLYCHRNDQEVLAYKVYGELRVTWASVPSTQLDGVERYLANTWPPLIGDCFPDVLPIAVNSPW